MDNTDEMIGSGTRFALVPRERSWNSRDERNEKMRKMEIFYSQHVSFPWIAAFCHLLFGSFQLSISIDCISFSTSTICTRIGLSFRSYDSRIIEVVFR